MKLALLSTYDKTGLVEFARQLSIGGYDLVSTGGTATNLVKGDLQVQEVSDLTGSPEILDGRVKTLHPKIHGGILARRDDEAHMAQLAHEGIRTIGIVVSNLYPFIETIRSPGATLERALENIDIGGPTMIRSAAKNFRSVLVVVDPEDYAWLGKRIKDSIDVTHEERKELARKAFQHVALYDTAISGYLSEKEETTSWEELTLGFNRAQELRYGENPHQKATLYSGVLSTSGIVDVKRLHGLEMSYTNILDADAAWRVVSDFSENTVAIIKHTNPCGIAVHNDQAIAYQNAFKGDSVSAYGGVVAFNRTVTTATADAMRGVLYDQLIAPGFDSEALNILKRRRRTRILEIMPASGPNEYLDVRSVSGGLLVQTADASNDNPEHWIVSTDRKPTISEFRDLTFAWTVCKHIKSNTIVLAKDNMMVGMGAGQPNRVVSVHLSLRIAGKNADGSVMASDAFFPFPDSIEMAAKGGITAIVQPGGSIRDNDAIEVANKLGITMMFAGTRHFRH